MHPTIDSAPFGAPTLVCLWCELLVRICSPLCLYLSSAASQMALTSTQGQKYWHNIWTKDEIMCLALAHCLCVLPFCCLWKGRCIWFFFLMTAVTNRHKQAVNEFWSPEVWNDCTRSKAIFLQDLKILWPFPAFRQCLHALEYSLHYYMPWSTPLHYCMHWSIPLHNSHISFSRYIPPTSPASLL